jgi:predicted MPP superfamily phosphohydrolase
LVAFAVGGAFGIGFLLGLASLVDLWIPLLPGFIVSYRPVFLFFLTAALGCLAYGYGIERRWIEVTHTRLEIGKLPAGTPPIRIVHLSDLHCTGDDFLESQVPGLIGPLRPDLILLTGDYLGSERGVKNLRTLLCSLRCPEGLFGVLGNHEIWDTPGWDPFEGTPVVHLNNALRCLSIRGNRVCLVGIRVESEEEGVPLLKETSADDINIVLYHYPDLIDRIASKQVDLLLAGHTHGGQIALPFFGAIVTLSKGWKRYERGLYRVGEGYLYVNRGLGTDLPPIRFFARPEIAVIDLIPPRPDGFNPLETASGATDD